MKFTTTRLARHAIRNSVQSTSLKYIRSFIQRLRPLFAVTVEKVNSLWQRWGSSMNDVTHVLSSLQPPCPSRKLGLSHIIWCFYDSLPFSKALGIFYVIGKKIQGFLMSHSLFHSLSSFWTFTGPLFIIKPEQWFPTGAPQHPWVPSNIELDTFFYPRTKKGWKTLLKMTLHDGWSGPDCYLNIESFKFQVSTTSTKWKGTKSFFTAARRKWTSTKTEKHRNSGFDNFYFQRKQKIENI